MKRLLIGALAALLSLTAAAVPISQISPTGSTSGQAILSTGDTTAPHWAAVSAVALTGLVPVANGGTGVATAAAELARIGAAPLANPVFINNVTLNSSNNVSVEMYSDTPAEQVVEVFQTGTPTTKYTFNFNKYGGASKFGGAVTVAGALSGTTAVLSSTLTTSGIVGVTSNIAAAAGSVGQVLEANASTISMTSASAGNVICESLTAGDWEVSGYVSFSPAASTTVSTIITGISTTSATLPVTVGSQAQLSLPFSTGANQALIAPTQNFLLASTTNVCLVSFVTFGVSTLTASGRIHAVRIH